MSYNPSRSTWINPNIEYVFNDEIVEYDMQDAGLSIIKNYKLLDSNTIKELDALPKEERHRSIGKLQINIKDLSSRLSEKFSEMRGLFISENNISSNNIISVKKDAIYTLGSYNKLKFGKVKFVPKNQYSSYIRFTDNMNIEIYYNDGVVDVKGISDSRLNRHRLYMLHFISKVINGLENKNPSIKRFIKTFINDYKSMNVDDGYYLEFNNKSIDINPVYNFTKVIIPLVKIIQKEIK